MISFRRVFLWKGRIPALQSGGMDVLQVDFDRNRAYLQEQLYGKKMQ